MEFGHHIFNNPIGKLLKFGFNFTGNVTFELFDSSIQSTNQRKSTWKLERFYQRL